MFGFTLIHEGQLRAMRLERATLLDALRNANEELHRYKMLIGQTSGMIPYTDERSRPLMGGKK